MFTFILLAAVFSVVVASIVVRLILRTILNPYRTRHPYFGPYGYYGVGRGYRRGPFPGGLLAILIFVTLERLFWRRW